MCPHLPVGSPTRVPRSYPRALERALGVSKERQKKDWESQGFIPTPTPPPRAPQQPAAPAGSSPKLLEPELEEGYLHVLGAVFLVQIEIG